MCNKVSKFSFSPWDQLGFSFYEKPNHLLGDEWWCPLDEQLVFKFVFHLEGQMRWVQNDEQKPGDHCIASSATRMYICGDSIGTSLKTDIFLPKLFSNIIYYLLRYEFNVY